MDKMWRDIEAILQQVEEPDVSLKFHKGGWCPVNRHFCQEGYCSDCQVYRDHPIFDKFISKKSPILCDTCRLRDCCPLEPKTVVDCEYYRE